MNVEFKRAAYAIVQEKAICVKGVICLNENERHLKAGGASNVELMQAMPGIDRGNKTIFAKSATHD